ncbi:MAG: SufE family protein [Bdellovibrionales bacterium]|nr:SufE family protein [Bdellovibrionales bacterium]
MSRLKERQQKIVQEFSAVPDWEERYKKVIALGKELPSLDDQYKTEKYIIKGCQSEAWMFAEMNDNGEVIYKADSEAMISRGIVHLLMKVYSQATPDEILGTEPDFVKEIGFESNLTPSRANGLFAMLKMMRYYAMAFKAMGH